MKDYEEKVINIMNGAKDNIRTQLDKAYKSGYEDAKSELGQNAIDLAHEENDRAYQQGLEDAWKTVQSITKEEDKGGYSDEMLEDLFRNLSIHMIVQRYAPQDVIRMIKEYENKHKQDTEIKVGDEVVIESGTKAVVLDIDEDGCYWILDELGCAMTFSDDEISKTSRHFNQIAEVLAEMRGEKC